MTQVYNKKYSLYKDGEKIAGRSTGPIIEYECSTATEEIDINWNNIEKMAERFYNILNVSLEKDKKIATFFDWYMVKEAKTPNLNLVLKVEYTQNNHYSLNDILNYPDATMAIKYIKERWEE